MAIESPSAQPGPIVVVATGAGNARGALAAAAAVAVAAAGLVDRDRPGLALVAEVDSPGARTPTILASAAARHLERDLRAGGFAAAARGALCWLALPGGAAGLGELERSLELVRANTFVVAVVPPGLWAEALDRRALALAGGLVRCDLPAARPLAALAAVELRERGLVARIDPRGLGPLASRRALAGLDPGGAAARRARRIAAAFTGGPGGSGWRRSPRRSPACASSGAEPLSR
jgi:hypothetical protein